MTGHKKLNNNETTMDVITSQRTRPFLKWLGNKYRCLDNILPNFPEGRRLVEPFAGSCAIFLNTSFKTYLLGEKSADLIHLYSFLQQEGAPFIAQAKNYFRPKYNQEAIFYKLRDDFNQATNKRKRALLFLYLNRHGYNGLCRYNLKGGFNVPFGRYDAPYFPEKEMDYFHQKSQGVSFLYADFQDTIKQAKKGDVVYFDPPYAPLSNSANFTGYTHTKFGEEEQHVLANLAQGLANRGIPSLISNHDTPFTRALYQNASVTSFKVQRFISCKGNKRKPVRELLALFT